MLSGNLKAAEGQYFTPAQVTRAAVRMLDIQVTDKIIDPACGTGGFLIEAFRDMVERIGNEAAVRTWAHRSIYGVDKDSINVKLTRAMMLVLGDGSTNIHIGDSIREDRWESNYPLLPQAMKDGTFSVVMANPPFGTNLKIAGRDSQVNDFSIAKAAGKGVYKDLEIGLVFLERAYRLLRPGGRMAIILPETYFFSSSYSFLDEGLKPRLALRGVVNIPMEAFQGFCRAKTNLYVFEKLAANGKTK
ncbi:SAM-dependent methyltransferase [Microbacterium esteraromaticum]|uniref:HsdM family class I SAM-dependent methyltransferase n=1 Tax=Microbacterium esteraromaticum TaxID=57043 RepID=UPI001CD500FA|nr:N-6 DNA methylase [Microbacterium esteraromaticum]MCA1307981.1 SAM-dependent methyltransferase [Microbacterium esteraromaticum]